VHREELDTFAKPGEQIYLQGYGPPTGYYEVREDGCAAIFRERETKPEGVQYWFDLWEGHWTYSTTAVSPGRTFGRGPGDD
jgi:hypothetical protein